MLTVLVSRPTSFVEKAIVYTINRGTITAYVQDKTSLSTLQLMVSSIRQYTATCFLHCFLFRSKCPRLVTFPHHAREGIRQCIARHVRAGANLLLIISSDYLASRLNYRECVDGHGLFEEDVVVAGANSGYLSNIRFAVPTLPRGTTAKDSHFKVCVRSHSWAGAFKLTDYGRICRCSLLRLSCIL